MVPSMLSVQLVARVKVTNFHFISLKVDFRNFFVFAEFITARLDSMRASEQLIVKCATVLGTTIPRDMIETILPNIPRVKARRSFKRLMQIGIFECANTPRGRAGVILQQGSVDPTACYCPKMEDDFDADLCNLMRFKNQLLQDTAYDVLMESQRLELHAKAAQVSG